MSLPSSMADFVPFDRLLQKAYCSHEVGGTFFHDATLVPVSPNFSMINLRRLSYAGRKEGSKE